METDPAGAAAAASGAGILMAADSNERKRLDSQRATEQDAC